MEENNETIISEKDKKRQKMQQALKVGTKIPQLIFLVTFFNNEIRNANWRLLETDFKYVEPSHVEDLINNYFEAESNKRKILRRLKSI